MFGPHAGEIWTKSLSVVMVLNVTNFEFFDKNRIFKKQFWKSVNAILQDVFVAERIV